MRARKKWIILIRMQVLNQKNHCIAKPQFQTIYMLGGKKTN
jgi:hypothetical protein